MVPMFPGLYVCSSYPHMKNRVDIDVFAFLGLFLSSDLPYNQNLARDLIQNLTYIQLWFQHLLLK